MRLSRDGHCPKCGAPINEATIEVHPTRPGRYIFRVECPACGWVHDKIIDTRGPSRDSP